LHASRIGLANVAPPPTRLTAYAGAATREKSAATREIFIKNLRTKVVSFVNRSFFQREPIDQMKTTPLVSLNGGTTLSELLVKA
jgi:hypothetical protein